MMFFFFPAHNLSHILGDLDIIYVGYERFYSPDFTLWAVVLKHRDEPDDFSFPFLKIFFPLNYVALTFQNVFPSILNYLGIVWKMKLSAFTFITVG